MSKFKGIIMHWTAGGKQASSLDAEHYHAIMSQDLTIKLGKFKPEDNLNTSDGRYAAHTKNCNTGFIGLAVAGMRNATQSPLNYGPDPIKQRQVEDFCMMVADYCVRYDIPVSRTTVLSHAEVQPTLKIKQNGKWDITVLPWNPSLTGPITVGDFLRDRVKHYVKKTHTINQIGLGDT